MPSGKKNPVQGRGRKRGKKLMRAVLGSGSQKWEVKKKKKS